MAPKPAAKKRKIGAPRKIDAKRDVEVSKGTFETMTCGEHIAWLIENFGMYLRDACAIAGCTESIAYRWIARGEEWLDQAEESEAPVEVPEDEVIFVEFCQAIRKARGEAKRYHLANVKRHARINWQASAWYLERTDPAGYGRRTRHEVTGEGGGPVKVAHFPDTDEWHEKVSEAYGDALSRRPEG